MEDFKKMRILKVLATSLVILALLPEQSQARYINKLISRYKRVSDQRVAELETIIQLAKSRGIMVTVPVGFGQVDPARSGRKRRSSRNDSTLPKLQQFLRNIEREYESIDAQKSSSSSLVDYHRDEESEGHQN